MRNFLFLFFNIFFIACTNPVTVIEGTLPNDKYDKQVVYWVPVEEENSKPVDSTYIQNNSFRLVITPCNYNKMGIVRLHRLFRMDIQEILVFTDPGTVQVKLDSISSSTGTPLNDVLQNWKDRIQAYNKDLYNLRKKYRDIGINEEDSINEAFKILSSVLRDDFFRIVAENKENEVGKFIYSLKKTSFTPEQIRELNMEIFE